MRPITITTGQYGDLSFEQVIPIWMPAGTLRMPPTGRRSRILWGRTT